ncbi:pseudouridine synthase [Stratiformator vulcanicus]|uniref:Pseudouridine synthase n=1 Tax=Stratiformator vulcanicus TaxID=2527980 RepID=A0A517R089_9PLAN|nr:pseudouridine synthase [Stratiformator vulcanicus]QDT37309.1 Ribosomal large subunit pseudouridine synthase B [Stratiformator vulcanicus]
MPEAESRLQKVLAEAGHGSRRACEELISEGRVTVDGETVTELGTKVDADRQDVRVDGERLKLQRKKYYLLNKPTGFLCTNSDPSGRRRAIDLIDDPNARLFTVGRLDESSEGLLLVTNDGELAERLSHPRYEVVRKYRVQVAGVPDAETLKSLREGLRFSDGVFQVSYARKLKTHGKSAFIEVELTQGQNREIRRLFARSGHKVMSLQRIAFGPLKLARLPVGHYRPLRGEELKQLKEFARGCQPKKRVKRSRRPSVKRSGVKKSTENRG